MPTEYVTGSGLRTLRWLRSAQPTPAERASRAKPTLVFLQFRDLPKIGELDFAEAAMTKFCMILTATLTAAAC